MATKKELRIIAKDIRKRLDIKDVSEKILNNFLASSYYKTSGNIALYYPTGTELDLTQLFDDKNKNFYLPKISDKSNEIFFVKYEKNKTVLTENKYKISEPEGNKINPQIIDLMILPALMADNNGYRLGYGGGYYDKFLNTNNVKAQKIILIPDELLVTDLPKETYDIPANIIITPSKIIEAHQK